jgi:NAD+--asparagine ADP-ribosyltransferase
MLKKARFVSMVVLAASVLMTSGLMVENLVLACLDLRKKK